VSFGGLSVENAVWSYKKAIEVVAEIKGYIAVYADKVDAFEETK
jgi:uncharacterized protein (DUF427 family)